MVGSIHGNETAGRAVMRRLRRATPPAGVELWLVRLGQPRRRPRAARARTRAASISTATSPAAGAAAGRPFDTYFPGRARVLRARVAGGAAARAADPARRHGLVPPAPAAREPLRRAPTRAIVRALRAPRRPARAARSRTTAAPPRAGRTTRFPGTSAFVVELPAGPLSPRVGAPPRARGARGRRAAGPPRGRAAARPPIVWRRSRSAPTRRAPDARATPAATTASTAPRCATRR